MKKLIYYFAVALMSIFNGQIFATDYVLNGHADIVAFVNAGTGVKENIGKLTIYGQDVTQADFNSIADRVNSCGTVTFENFTNGTGWSDANSVGGIGGFFNNIICKGGIIFRNCKYMTWPDGFNDATNNIKHVYGDLIFDHTNFAQPGVDGWSENLLWAGVEQVDGDFIFTHYTNKMGHGTNGYKLKKVGGNFEVSHPIQGGNTTDNAVWSWETGFQNLETVGGKFTIDGDNFTVGGNSLKVWTLDCLSKITSIGGDVKIVNLPGVGVSGTGNWPYGYCYVRYLIDAGVIDYAHHNVILNDTIAPIDLVSLGGCADGVTPDNPPVTLPIKLTGLSDLKNSITKVQVANNTLKIDSKVDLSKVEVFSVTGSCLLNFSNVPAGISAHSISSISNGIYLIKLISNKISAVYKVIK